MDALYIDIFLSDLDRALNHPIPQPLVPHTSYKMWAESYYSFRESPQARASVKWHVKYLHGIQTHFDEAQWPRVEKRSAFDPTGKAYGKGALHSFSVPQIAALRKSHPLISPAIIIKAALALLNTHYTGHDHAVFASVQAGRTQWPFMPASFGKHVGLGLFDEATDVAGPLMQSVTNLIKILPDEPVLDMLHRLQTDQEALTLHAHAPWPAIEETLDKTQRNRFNTGLLGSHRGLTKKIFSTQVFNWIPGMGAQGGGLKEEFINFRKLTAVTRSQIGLLVRAGIGGPAGDTVILFIRGDGLTDGQMEEVAQKMEVLVRSLTRIDNWNAPISRCMLHEDVVLQESL
ncbi:unnamed protein product [Penicillium salamii]|uniref:Uncharacterized protein n=1 Tax=Penicillium salamii TaxID=1612424 RepID=A0A9W4JPF8_9EURO|nr:unnamed protein product [Penicillium salamii]CAG8252394.1 unnamed protein product [Penicillium salamii]CAG8270733.1 unnamed protein product [Penicillium salamii]CAG8272963.1 unnamed protein product [Penicillium salamii]CAG8284486.1 unnamed protein product [Penicillium salamii]